MGVLYTLQRHASASRIATLSLLCISVPLTYFFGVELEQGEASLWYGPIASNALIVLGFTYLLYHQDWQECFNINKSRQIIDKVRRDYLTDMTLNKFVSP